MVADIKSWLGGNQLQRIVGGGDVDIHSGLIQE